MSKVLVNVRMDAEDKKGMEEICRELGMSMSTAINVFVKKVLRERRIPFELSSDPFYSEANMAHIRRAVRELEAGHGTVHDLIEVDDE
ncbi:MAG: type II toxin-antitoxin system RelB/DinJ family antitoxin [Clostridia bacterium]|nr:type II toxin-antitoxin system RelB/DinJ family antitoxin [Clostridia bacterium]